MTKQVFKIGDLVHANNTYGSYQVANRSNLIVSEQIYLEVIAPRIKREKQARARAQAERFDGRREAAKRNAKAIIALGNDVEAVTDYLLTIRGW